MSTETPTEQQQAKFDDLIPLLLEEDIIIQFGSDNTTKGSYVTVSTQSDLVKPIVEYVSSIDDVAKVVAKFLKEDVTRITDY